MIMVTDMETFRLRIEAHMEESARVKRATATACEQDILRAVELIAKAFRAGNKLLLCGNGGSAADCQHLASEFVNRLTKNLERPPLPAIALTTDTSFLTSYANDYEYEGVFARQVQALGKAGDVLIGISTSGKSPNILRAVEIAREMGLQTIALMGVHGQLAGAVHVTIAVPSSDTQYIQESHLAIEHLICKLVEDVLYGPGSSEMMERRKDIRLEE